MLSSASLQVIAAKELDWPLIARSGVAEHHWRTTNATNVIGYAAGCSIVAIEAGLAKMVDISGVLSLS